MRIWDAEIPPGYLRWAATGAGMVVLGVLIAIGVSATGLLGTSQEDQGTKINATVVTSTPCTHPDAKETVKFKINDKTHQAKFDGCGHEKNEQIKITIPTTTPTTPLPPNLTVHASNATTGDQKPGKNLSLLLIVTSSTAGATYAFLIRRGPRKTQLPKPLRLAA
jgi:hypothetical protein